MIDQLEMTLRVRQIIGFLEFYPEKISFPKGLFNEKYQPLKYPSSVTRYGSYAEFGSEIEEAVAVVMKNIYGPKFYIPEGETLDDDIDHISPIIFKSVSECVQRIVITFPPDRFDVHYQRELSYKNIQGHPDFIFIDRKGKTYIFDCKVFWKFNKNTSVLTKRQLLSYASIFSKTLGTGKLGGIGLITPWCKSEEDTVEPLKIYDVSSWLVSKEGCSGSEFLKALVWASKACIKDIHTRVKWLTPGIGHAITYRIGRHVSRKDLSLYLGNGFPLQIFLYTNLHKRSDTFPKVKLPDLSKDYVIVHAPYNINLSVDEDWIAMACYKYLKMANEVGCRGVVFHCGHHPNEKIGVSIQHKNIRKAIDMVGESIYETPFLLETSCGAGTELLGTPEKFSRFIKKFDTTEVGICFDTCHAFVSGAMPTDYLMRLGRVSNRVSFIHFNGSRKRCGCKADGHANPFGFQNIPEEELEGVLQFAEENGAKCIVE